MCETQLLHGLEGGLHGIRSGIQPEYYKTPFFRGILILRFSYVENTLHFNLAYFPVNII